MSQPLKTASSDVDAALDQLAQLIHERAGLRFNDTRRRFFQSRVEEAARTAGYASIRELYENIVNETRSADHGGLFQTVVDHIVTDETSFFRYSHQFDTLRNYIFPALASNREFSDGDDQVIRILSAGSSRGHEPYSIAMSALEEHETLRGLKVVVYALDLSQNVLDIAREGVYDASQVRGLEPKLLARYFDTVDGGRGRPDKYRVRPEARNMVRFQRHNLLRELPGPIFDVIFCRNVTIYFNEETTRRVARNLYDRLRPGGYMFLGHAESYYGILPELTILQFGETLVNRKPIK